MDEPTATPLDGEYQRKFATILLPPLQHVMGPLTQRLMPSGQTDQNLASQLEEALAVLVDVLLLMPSVAAVVALGELAALMAYEGRLHEIDEACRVMGFDGFLLVSDRELSRGLMAKSIEDVRALHYRTNRSPSLENDPNRVREGTH
jgi:hypothetical protein